MGIKSTLVKPFAHYIHRQIQSWSKTALDDQINIMHNIVRKAKSTAIGKDYEFENITSYKDFAAQVPVKDYEDLKMYFDRVVAGESDVLWPGRPKYFAKTSGTTSGVKYIPLTHDSMPNHMQTARNALFCYIGMTGNSHIFDGKLIFLSGSPRLDKIGDVQVGRLSGIVNHEVPAWARNNQVPSFETNCIEDWEIKLDRIVEETLHSDMRLISGIPPWVVMFYERLLEKTGKETIRDIFPNYSVFVHGGVNYEPYSSILREMVGDDLDTIETYPASEGFIAFQDNYLSVGLLLNTRSGIFFEFVPSQEVFAENPTRLHLGQVEKDVDYALIINSNAGLWGYLIGDLIRFISLNPYKITVTGRVTHFISAFGEHVIANEVENALMGVAHEERVGVVEFTVAPHISPEDSGLPYHEWFVEFNSVPKDLDSFSRKVDLMMQKQNIYYKDLIKGNILRTLKIRPLKKESFREYMKQKGKLGGQNKVPRLSNDRSIAEQLKAFEIR